MDSGSQKRNDCRFFLTSIPLIICDGYKEVTYFPQSAFLFDNQIVRRFAGEKRDQDTF